MTLFNFDGETYVPALDQERLSSQFLQVKDLMSDGQWHTLTEIATAVGGSEAAVSARVRDLRKSRFGGYTVERRRATQGLFEYRLVV